jgi:hypothetical protein
MKPFHLLPMKKPDKPVKTISVALVSALLSLSLVLGVATPLHAQQTEAEKASLSERPLTANEKKIRNRGCKLPKPSGSVRISNRDISVVTIDEMVFLKLLSARKNAVGANFMNSVKLLPLLPVGGIGPRDFCDASTLLPMASKAEGGKVFFALLLRTGLNLAQDYPSSIAQMRKNSQIFTLPAGKYIILPARYDSEVKALEGTAETVLALGQLPRYEANGTGFWLRNTLFIPLAPDGGS